MIEGERSLNASIVSRRSGLWCLPYHWQMHSTTTSGWILSPTSHCAYIWVAPKTRGRRLDLEERTCLSLSCLTVWPSTQPLSRLKRLFPPSLPDLSLSLSSSHVATLYLPQSEASVASASFGKPMASTPAGDVRAGGSSLPRSSPQALSLYSKDHLLAA